MSERRDEAGPYTRGLGRAQNPQQLRGVNLDGFADFYRAAPAAALGSIPSLNL